MALIKCKECGTEVSSKAKTCPKCGVQIAIKQSGCGTLIGVIFLGWIIISVFSNLGSNTSLPKSSPVAPTIQTPPPPAPTLPGSQWSYHQGDDKMDKGSILMALVSSSNTVDFEFPYAGAQHATLMLRTSPRLGENIIFSIEKGQILCNSYDDCTVLIRFDDEKGVRFTAAGSADNSTVMIFIHGYNRFVEKMLKAKRVRIAAEIYQQGAPVFEFDVSGFNQNKYQQKK